MGNAIGSEAMGRVLDVTDELRACVRDEFEPYEGVYRLNDMGEYVSEEDWLNVWAGTRRGGRRRGCSPTTGSSRQTRSAA